MIMCNYSTTTGWSSFLAADCSASYLAALNARELVLKEAFTWLEMGDVTSLAGIVSRSNAPSCAQVGTPEDAVRHMFDLSKNPGL